MQIELSDFIRTRKLDHQLCMSRQTHQIWRMIWVDCSTLYVLDTIISWKLKCVSGISWNAEQREKFAWENWGPLWSLLMQRGHLQPSLRAGGLESYCRTAQVSTPPCSCVSVMSLLTTAHQQTGQELLLGHLYWLNTVLVHCITSPPSESLFTSHLVGFYSLYL